MTFTQKLDILMSERGITRAGFARDAGIPYTTIVGFYEKGSDNIKLSNLKRIASFFGVSIEYLCDDNSDAEKKEVAAKIVKKYSALSEKGRKMIEGLIDGIMEIESIPAEEEVEPEFIREYTTPAAAGYASPAEGEDYVLVRRMPEVPEKTDFAVRISGDSMEPYIADGSRVYVSRTNELSQGDVGIFFIDGDMKCKQYCEDNLGNIYLFSLNRARADADVAVPATSGITVFCFGKVLLKKRPPLPAG